MKIRDIEEMSDTEKITVGIDVFPSIFRMKNKILGDNNENAEYILNETGAVMTLRGKGSGFIDFKDKKESDEPLHVHVRYKNFDGREKTRELILNLIDTVQQDFINSTYGKYYSPPKKPEIISVPLDKIRRTSSYNSLSNRSPVRNNDRSIDRRSVEKHNLDNRIIPESRPYDNRASETRSYERHSPSESRPYEKRPSLEPRPYEKRSSLERPYENRAPEPRSYENRHPEPRLYESRASEPRPYDSRPSESRPFENRAPEPRPFASRAIGSPIFDERPPAPRPVDRPPESNIFEIRPAETRPFESRPVEMRPFESRPAETRPFESRPAETRPFEKRTRESRFESLPVQPRPFEAPIPDRRPIENPLPDSTKLSPTETISSNIEKITIGIESVPPAFNLKSKIYGPNLANVKHIEKVANALLLVEGKGCGVNSSGEESLDPPYILVKYIKPDLKDTARGLIFNLIETIQQEYIQLYGRYPGGPQKPQILPIKKLVNDKLSSEPIKVKKPSPDIVPVPPPPPVISKTLSPDRFDNVPPPVGFGITIPKPPSQKLFANAEPTPVPKPVQPVIPTSSNVYDPFSRLSEPDPLPVAAPLSGISSQSSILNSVLSPQTRLRPSVSFANSESSQAQIQTIQYSEKRPQSPVESVATEAKRFCSTGVGTFNSTIPSIPSIPPSVPAPVHQKVTITAPPSGKGKNQFQRNLIPVTLNQRNTASPAAANSLKLAPVVKPAVLSVPTPPAPAVAKPKPAGILKKPEWNNMRNGSNREKSDSEDEGRVSNPIILSDSEDEELNSGRNALRISSTVTTKSGRDISVQTDDKLYQTQIKNIKCACGRFMHVVTGVRSVETQTIGGDSFRRF